jgi:hypothetical protein
LRKTMIDSPLMLYVPGLLPKPEAAVHRRALLRCLLAGLEREDAAVAAEVSADRGCFDLVAWTYDFYGEHRDFAIDAEAVDALIENGGADAADRAEATSWHRNLLRRVFMLADRLPVLIPHVATRRMEMHLRDLRRYLQNRNGIGEHTRHMLMMPLRAAVEAGRPILLIGHSMGSVIAWDSLWHMTHVTHERARIDRLLTMGSPLGQRFLQRRIAGSRERGAAKYPGNIGRWINIAAAGDLTALDPTLADDFAEMVELGAVASIEDVRIYNGFRLNGELNPHAEYGYLASGETARIIAAWWRSQR